MLWFNRSSLLNMTSSNIGDADMSRLYAATSLMQIDDSIMRWRVWLDFDLDQAANGYSKKKKNSPITDVIKTICPAENFTATARWRSTMRRRAVCTTSTTWVCRCYNIIILILLVLLLLLSCLQLRLCVLLMLLLLFLLLLIQYYSLD